MDRRQFFKKVVATVATAAGIVAVGVAPRVVRGKTTPKELPIRLHPLQEQWVCYGNNGKMYLVGSTRRVQKWYMSRQCDPWNWTDYDQNQNPKTS